MHRLQREWCLEIKQKFPKYFYRKTVLDIGSLDVNGNNKYLFDECLYYGLDVIKGPNVDIVSIAHEFETDNTYDVILSTNALEHDMFYKKTLIKMTQLLKPKGLLFFSAGHKYKEHGTIKTTPNDSGTAKLESKWSSYYKNIEKKDILNSIDIGKIFKKHNLEVYKKDIRFWGIKNEY